MVNIGLKARAAVVVTVLMLSAFFAETAWAKGEVAVYTAPDGFKVISYSREWNDVNKLQQVYLELLRNAHGEEFKLLTKVNIYSGADPEGLEAAGRWYGVWTVEGNKPKLLGNRYIDIYNGDEMNTVDSIARTLSHEYGHHFTYYYYFKNEKKMWEQWRSTGLAKARGLLNNPLAGAETRDHQWLIQEICAEDYVQLFGSATVKKSVKFADIAERLALNQPNVTYSTDIYNYHPQENYRIPLAANMPQLMDYWLKASGLKLKSVTPPPQIGLYLLKVNRLEGVPTHQYVFGWDKVLPNTPGILDYTLVYFDDTDAGYFPVRTVSDGEPMTAVFGSARNSDAYIWENLPAGIGYFMVIVKDSSGLVTSSKVLAVDFSDPQDPQSVLIDDSARANGKWFQPRVKINGKQMSFAVPPFIYNSRMLVPLRDIFQELGATVTWDGLTQQITAARGGTQLNLRIGQYLAEINGTPVTLDAPPQIKDGKTMVPLSFVSTALGGDVSWDQSLQLATINQE